MCKYCSRTPVFLGKWFPEYENEEEIAYGPWTSIRLGVDEKGKLIIVAIGDGRAIYYPKYCPECGNKLEME